MAKKRIVDFDAYPFVVRRLTADEGGGYLVEYTDVPYCIADGKTADEAIRHGREALEACLITIAEADTPFPRPNPRGAAGSGVSGSRRAFMRPRNVRE